MKFKTITVSVGAKRSINFCSASVDVGATVELEEMDDPAAVVDELQRQCVSAVDAALKEHAKRLIGT